MENFIERVKKGQFWKFHGGIHPPEQKFLTNSKPIKNIPLPDELIIPLQQHIGNTGSTIVSIGDKVLKGQPLTESDTPMSVAVHAPTSGTITAIKKAPIAHPSGMEEVCIFLKPDLEDKWVTRNFCPDYNKLSNQDILEKVANAGISGMGGAGFPTLIKISGIESLDTLIINAAECEPYITADDLLIREHVASIIDGIKILIKLIDPKQILIGIEDNKPEAVKTLKENTADIDNLHVCVLPTLYPSGGEKQLIKLLTGKEITSGKLPKELGIVVQNVATCYAIADAVINDTPLIKRVVTVSGQALERPQNIWALIGTPVGHLFESCGYLENDNQQVIMGGPMMGFSLPSLNIPIIKTSNCILAPSKKEMPAENNEVECIRCGQCADVCPSVLLPQELQWSAKAKDQPQLKKLNLFDCIECGACAYVCPSQIPLVHYYRIAKAEIRAQQLQDVKAEHAKKRFEARKLRLEREKKAREEKHKKAAEARKARMNAGTPEANKEKSAVAAALARVKAKKAQSTEEPQDNNLGDDKKQQVSDAIARAKAKKLAKAAKTEQVEASSAVEEAKVTEAPTSKKDKVASAVAKAKAKKLAKAAKTEQVDENSSAEEAKVTEAPTSKKDKVASAVAKAKAKKLAKGAKTEQLEDTSENEKPAVSETSTESKKDKIASAIAKAKAKKQASNKKTKQATDTITEESSTEIKAPKSKKEKVASAIANAKAKKLAKDTKPKQTEEKPSSEAPSKAETNMTKKEQVAAVIAKAKAKKLKESENKETLSPESLKKVKPKDEEYEKNEAEKKKRIASAVAKAKAKKQAEKENS